MVEKWRKFSQTFWLDLCQIPLALLNFVELLVLSRKFTKGNSLLKDCFLQMRKLTGGLTFCTSGPKTKGWFNRYAASVSEPLLDISPAHISRQLCISAVGYLCDGVL